MPVEAPKTAQTVQLALLAGIRRLAEAGIEGAPRDARFLMAHALQIDAGRLTLHTPDEIDSQSLAVFEACVKRRISREPISHILGKRHFYGRDFIVTSDVLDPRPETEILISEALKRPYTSVLDMGVGSGAILLTLLAEKGEAIGLGSDLSRAALDVAAQNAEALGVTSQVTFQASDWFEAIDPSKRFDLIVSNPPYIATDEMSDLSPELSHEPRMALTDEADGLTPYRVIAARALDFLTPKGWILFEIGPTQGAVVCGFLKQAGCVNIGLVQDFDGRDRTVCAQKP
jgi:release factor glutamine methyltransferase